MNKFDYSAAFDRNLGFLTHWDQDILRHKTAAIAGVGGAGGLHLLTLARLGIGNFHIADLDQFEIVNFNRQVGATVSTIGKNKTDVMAKAVLDINPTANIRLFPNGVQPDNVDDFLNNVDILIDGVDAFVPDLRQLLYQKCHEKGIPGLTAVPLGMGASYMIFLPGGMTFEEYFAFGNRSFRQKIIRFILGFSPNLSYSGYLLDKSRMNLDKRLGSSTFMACQLCSGAVGVSTLKILLNRGKIYPAPYYHSFDPYLNSFCIKKLSGGSKNIIHKLKIFLADKFINPPEGWADSPIPDNVPLAARILHAARWAPSSANSQPWRFANVSDTAASVTFQHKPGIFNPNGILTSIDTGIFLETTRIAASAFGCTVQEVITAREDQTLEANLTFSPSDAPEHPLAGSIPLRSVNRFAYKTSPLTKKHKQALEAAASPLQVLWIETSEQTKQMTAVTAAATDLRLRTPEIFPIHQRMFQNKHPRFSPDGLPLNALGLSWLTSRITLWGLESWGRMSLLNTLQIPRIAQFEMDILPGEHCAGFFILTINPDSPANGENRFLTAGRHIQRLWLTMTSLGIAMQPQMAALCFSLHDYHNTRFTQSLVHQKAAREIRAKLEQICPLDRIVFMGRLGYPKSTFLNARSVRKPFADLLATDHTRNSEGTPSPHPTGSPLQ